MKNSVEREYLKESLDKLLDKEVLLIGRDDTVFVVKFGIYEDIKNPSDEKKEEMLRYNLYIFSVFRIVASNGEKVIVGDSDIYTLQDTSRDSEEFAYYKKGLTSFDNKSKEWIRNIRHNKVFVKDYNLNQVGDLKLYFSNGDCLEVYVDTCTEGECWRIFDNLSEKEDVVVTGQGIFVDDIEDGW